MAESPSQRFGAYRLLRRLGKGGMGEAWRARKEGPAGIHKDVVIKRILKAYGEDQGFRENFVHEARLSARLSHGNIAQVFDFGEVDGEWFMALEYVHGRPLSRVVDRAREKGLRGLPTPVALYIAIEALKGLHHAHTRVDDAAEPLNIVHRDVSPDNVMVSFDGEVKLLDFGIAKARLAGGQETQTGLVKGKVRYFSPEQAQGEEVDARSDLWSAALVLYEMLAGRPALEGAQHVVLMKLARGEVPHVRVRAPWVPEPLADLINKALQPEREARYPTALAFQEALGDYLHRTAPSLSQSSVAGTMAWLFDDELTFEGRSAEISASVKSLIDESTANHALPDADELSLSKKGTVELQATPSAPAAAQRAPPRKLSPVAWAVAGGAGALALGVVGYALAIGLTPGPADGPLVEEEAPWPKGVRPPRLNPAAPPPTPAPKVEPTAAAADPTPQPGAQPAPPAPPAGEKPKEPDETRQNQLALKIPAAAKLDVAIDHYNSQRYQQAADAFELAIHQGGREWMPVMMLGLCKVKLGKWQEARGLLNESLQGQGKHAPMALRADAAYALAIAAEALGMRQEAFNRLRQSFKLTHEVDIRLAQVRKEPQLKQLRATPEYQELLAWVDDGMGSKRSRRGR